MYEYAKVIYRISPRRQPKTRVRLLKLNKPYEFQRKILAFGDQILQVIRLTKEMYEEEKQKLDEKRMKDI